MHNSARDFCQQAGAGLGMKYLQIKWPNEAHSVEDCFSIMFPHSYFGKIGEDIELASAEGKIYSLNLGKSCSNGNHNHLPNVALNLNVPVSQVHVASVLKVCCMHCYEVLKAKDISIQEAVL